MASSILSRTPAVALHRLQPRRFRRGDQVEVASMEEGFDGSYYEATVVADKAEHGYLIQYRTLLKEDMSGPLQEMVTAAEVRPRPPPVTVAGYGQVDDVVDAYDNDGWWWGRITGRGGDDGYKVFFDTSGDEIVYPKNRLRVHQEFINGRWVHYT